MKKEELKKIAMAAGALLLLLDSVWILNMKGRLRSLESQLSGTESRISNSMYSMESRMESRYTELEELLKREQSILSDSSVDFKLKGDKVLVRMQAIPKEISKDEEIVARIYAGEAMYETKADAGGCAELLIDMAESVKPVFLIRSENGVRQEAMEETYTGYLFEADIYSVWGDSESTESWGLTTWVNARDGGSLPFSPEDVETAEYVVKNTGTAADLNGGENSGQATESAVYISAEEQERIFDEDAGERIPAAEMNGANAQTVGYYADLSRYRERGDGIEYEVYLCLTTKDKTRFYTPYNSVSTFISDKNTESRSCGYGILVPVYPER